MIIVKRSHFDFTKRATHVKIIVTKEFFRY